ncbi:RES family NAD+ phosphorylase [Ralstonia pseudosolanacearum]|nr:RES family NAD+ phosphorylase [Ralstonia pseudosolanacearum]
MQEVISRVIGCDNRELCGRLVGLLVEDCTSDEDEYAFFADGQTYMHMRSPFDCEEDERAYAVGEWRRIADKLTYGQRFFNFEVEAFFDEVIDSALDVNSSDGGAAVVRILPSGTKFFRARILLDRRDLSIAMENPSSFLGAPPREKAAHNRMNPAGISFLYAADCESTCLAEVRPSIGDEVLVGAIATRKPLKFFDFNGLDGRPRLSKIDSFWPDYASQVRTRALLTYLHDEIARPVDRNQHGYVATQAIAEFIRYQRPEGFDGIAFRSVQREGGINYVFFGDREAGGALSVASIDQSDRFPVQFEGKPQLFRVSAVKFQADAIQVPMQLLALGVD